MGEFALDHIATSASLLASTFVFPPYPARHSDCIPRPLRVSWVPGLTKSSRWPLGPCAGNISARAPNMAPLCRHPKCPCLPCGPSGPRRIPATPLKARAPGALGTNRRLGWLYVLVVLGVRRQKVQQSLQQGAHPLCGPQILHQAVLVHLVGVTGFDARGF